MANVYYQFDMFEDAYELKCTQNASEAFESLTEIDESIRQRIKHKELFAEEEQYLEKLREHCRIIDRVNQ